MGPITSAKPSLHRHLQVLAVNLRAVAQFTSAVAVPLVAAGRPAAVVNVSSMQAFFGLENQAAYGPPPRSRPRPPVVYVAIIDNHQC